MRRLLLAALAGGALAVPVPVTASAECYTRPPVRIEDGTLYVTVNHGYCQWTEVAVPLGTPVPPAAAGCPSHALISHQDGVTYVNVPTGRCTYEAVPLPAPPPL